MNSEISHNYIKPGEWISTDDCLPDKDDIVLGYNTIFHNRVLFRFDGGNRFYYTNVEYMMSGNVSYWMQIPEVPEK